ncbi:MAG: hypothetical protein ACXWW0_00245 [Bacteroidia bacterium]
MAENYDPDFGFWDDDDELVSDLDCPNCGRAYDDVDFEYQICHRCDHVNLRNKKNLTNQHNEK